MLRRESLVVFPTSMVWDKIYTALAFISHSFCWCPHWLAPVIVALHLTDSSGFRSFGVKTKLKKLKDVLANYSKVPL
jgi:hypothetical protein